jgi:hypothetical protein
MNTSIKYQYCNSWDLFYQKIDYTLTEEETKKRHSDKKQYTVIIGSYIKPDIVIEFIPGAETVFVNFLDEQLKPYLNYHFEIVDEDPENLFLIRVVYREFAEKEEEGSGIYNMSGGEMYQFERNGKCTITVSTYNPDKYKQKEINNSLEEISSNYEKYPEFGEYESIIRKER